MVVLLCALGHEPRGTGRADDDSEIVFLRHCVTCNHSAILNLSFFGPDQALATKWPPGLILGAFCIAF